MEEELGGSETRVEGVGDEPLGGRRQRGHREVGQGAVHEAVLDTTATYTLLSKACHHLGDIDS